MIEVSSDLCISIKCCFVVFIGLGKVFLYSDFAMVLLVVRELNLVKLKCLKQF